MGALNKAAKRAIAAQWVFILISFAIMFLAAGTIAWVNGWVYFVLACLSQIITTAVLAKVNPQVLNARAGVVKEGTKTFDKIWVALYPILSIANIIIIAFDAVRFHWTSMPFWLSIFGIVLLIPALVIATWAMAVNKFFEWTVRIQNETNQYVCKDGPYRFIRHPGYAGLILSVLSYPFILGSWWGFVLSGVLTIVIITRTALEDRTLQKELTGYREYAQTVKYRLAPYIW
jgi:protein-S-isoprenylcysteine O-methyltransferase Ste14